MVDIQGPGDSEQAGHSLAPARWSGDRGPVDLESRVTSVAFALDSIRRHIDVLSERTARTEGVASALFGAVEAFRTDLRDLTGRIEQRIVRALEYLDTRISRAQDSEKYSTTALSDLAETLLKTTDVIRDQVASSTSRLEARLEVPAGRPSLDASLQHHEAELARIWDEVTRIGEQLDTLVGQLPDWHKHSEAQQATQNQIAAVEKGMQNRSEALEARLEETRQSIKREVQDVVRASDREAQITEETVDKLVASLERLDSRLSRQVSSSEYALQGSVADLERKLSEQISEALVGIEARFRQREETLVRLIIAGGSDRLDRRDEGPSKGG